MIVLKKGEILFHGTDADFEPDDIRDAAWFTRSRSVAEHFGSRFGWGDGARVHSYMLVEDLELPDFHSKAEFDEFLESHGIEGFSPEELSDGILDRCLPGWVIPNNYPNGDDILINNTDILSYVETLTIAYRD